MKQRVLTRSDIFNPVVIRNFLNRVKKTKTCWIWLGDKTTQGYGSLYHQARKRIKAHRYSYLLNKGRIPKGAMILHKCDRPWCVKPAHLYIGDAQRNYDDRNRKAIWAR